jgi:hypothetical protein
MMMGTSGRAAFALGKSFRPVIPGMLMSDRIKMIETPSTALQGVALVVAGVIGDKRFGYDLWDDTVNVASRMEASCL